MDDSGIEDLSKHVEGEERSEDDERLRCIDVGVALSSFESEVDEGS